MIEVSSSAGLFDRLVKMPLYARAGVRQAWLVDLDANVVEIYRLHDEGEYGGPERCDGTAPVVIDALPDLTLTATDILG